MLQKESMNFLMRSTTTNHVPADRIPVHDSPVETVYSSKTKATVEGLIADDPFPQSPVAEVINEDLDESGNDNFAGSTAKESLPVGDHLDVPEEEGTIIIPIRELPETWNNAADIDSLRSLDRSFIFPGEQVHIIACLLANQQDTEIITPFKVAAVLSKNGMGENFERQKKLVKDGKDQVSGEEEVSSSSQQFLEPNDSSPCKLQSEPQNNISASESILRMEGHKRQTETLLQRFTNSHFFVRIAESSELLWSKRSCIDPESNQKLTADATRKASKENSQLSALIDRGGFDAHLSGGAARNKISSFSLSNGDIVVLLKVNIGASFFKDPVIEIIQFEKNMHKNVSVEDHENLNYIDYDPYGELLKWLLPLENTLPAAARSLPPLHLGSGPGIGGTSQKPMSTSSQLLSHFRSYSMSSLPQNTLPPMQHVKALSSKHSLDLDDWGQYSTQKLWKSHRTGSEGYLSFRGVSLERERFSVRCGLQGIFTPGRRWRRKVEIIQPLEIHSFAADCNTDDLVCVQIKNVSPEHTPDVIMYIDAITIVFEEAAKSGPPSSLPLACIEAGDGHSLPNLPLRRGEEHSFILKPTSSTWKNLKVQSEKHSPSSSLRIATNITEGRKSSTNVDQYAIMVSCHCNYTESRLFFKQPTSWRPRISRDLMICVASEISERSQAPNERVSQLPVQILTLQASNLTSEDLTLTVLAPTSFISPSLGSLGSSPLTPVSPFVSLLQSTGTITIDVMQRLTSATHASENHKNHDGSGAQSVSFNEQFSPISDVIPISGVGCTHLWLQSRVPLGCVPAQSSSSIKLELLPLTDGIIILDTLQIHVKEKGLTYIPEHSLKINATSGICTGII
ncbi:hypothetical protein K2173_021883 [Erythroxylum novogranatense]|uniref:Uncharacterized protein n=1 Tax=Erythroxylum novogranatense TaxID=1862640 RepID=A0AAV8T3K1_9ROSI|nr:hypothetical protein K2173_021883 [Erythroxylum novogranatense]